MNLTGTLRIVTALCFAMAVTAQSAANAATILVFGQNGTGTPVTATPNGTNTATTIAGTDIGVTITGIENIVGSVQAYLTFSFTSVNSATGVANISQDFSGSFSFRAGAGGTGTNYLSGSFTDFGTGAAGGSGFTLTAADPPDSVNFSSDVITSLFEPLSVNFAFSDIDPSLAIVGSTLRGFTASVAGNFNGTANPVPEPASMLLLGTGLLGLASSARRRLRRQ